MRTLFDIVVFLFVGLAVGYYTVDYAVTRGFSPIVKHNGPWSVWLNTASPTADPYTRAHFSAFGKLGLKSFEALEFRAETDDEGEPLRQSCTYAVTGGPLSARWWNIAAYQGDRTLIANQAQRFSFNSAGLVRKANGDFEIALSNQAQPGNWLPLGSSGRFRLVMTLFDPSESYRSDPERIALPRIVRRSC